jgi:ankyrin repeat protein
VECVKLLLKFPTIRKFEACGPNKNSQTPIHLAAAAQAQIMVKYLLNNGFDHSKPDSEGYTPLHLAANSGNNISRLAEL